MRVWILPLFALGLAGQEAERPMVRGVVVEAGSGAAVEGVEIRCGSAAAKSGSDGKFEFERPQTGCAQAVARKAGYLLRVVRIGTNTGALTIAMQRASVLRGMVVDEEKQPVANADVGVFTLGKMNGRPATVSFRSTRSDATGSFVFGDLRAGTYYLRVAAGLGKITLDRGKPEGVSAVRTYYPGASDLTGALPLSLGVGEELRDVRVELATQETFCVRAQLGGSEEEATRMVFLREKGVGMDWTIADGTVARKSKIRYCGLSPGPYLLTSGTKQAIESLVEFTVVDEDVDLGELPPVASLKLEGSVRSKGEAVEGVKFGLRHVDRNSREPEHTQASSDAEGKIEWASLLPGKYWLEAWNLPKGSYVERAEARGRDVWRHPVEASEGPIEVTLGWGTGDLTVAVEGKETALVVVQRLDCGENEPDCEFIRATNETGRARFSELRPGRYQVVAIPERDEHLWHMRKFPSRWERVEVPVRGSAQVAVKLRD